MKQKILICRKSQRRTLWDLSSKQASDFRACSKTRPELKLGVVFLTKGLCILPILIIAILLVSCKPLLPIEPKEKTAKFETSQELKKFSSVQEIRDFLKNSQLNAGYGGVFERGLGVRTRGLEIQAIAQTAAISTAEAAPSISAVDYSQTNIQVEGVDEADFVKNDGKYIYVISQNKLVIVEAFPAENAKILSETKIEGRARDMFVNKDRLVIFAEDNEQVPVFAEYDFIPRPRYTSKTHIFVYDISSKGEPKLVKDYNLNGNYFESRMIGDYVYFIVRENVYYYNDLIVMPIIKESSAVIAKPDIYYFDNPEINYNFNTVASFNIFSGEDEINAKTFLMGYSNNIYVSQNNIYITYQKNLPYIYYKTHNEEQFFNVVAPLLPDDIQSRIIDIKSNNKINSYEKWSKISAILEEMYNKMDENDKQKLIDKIEEAIQEYEVKLEAERRKTVIHKIKIDKGEIEYVTRGEVMGYLLNQFSMDEYNDYFRVATTTEIWARKSVMYNNVYVLDSKLNIAGKIEAIAPDERIYSTRFIGDRLYMVTFKRIDPLFVIDLSDSKNPQILGELKIPGFSDYLHPYDENHIIGIGKETGSNEWNGVSIKGVKLALFEVSDVKNPKLLDKYEIGEAGTDSEALREHKAFLFDKKKNILVIPVTEVKGKQYYDNRLGYYRQKYWQGAYVFGLTPEDGFKVKGKVTHNEGDEEQRYSYYGSPNAVRRALYMDDVLYTVSGIKIKANDLINISNEIKEIKLPYEGARYYEYPYIVSATTGIAVEEVVEESVK